MNTLDKDDLILKEQFQKSYQNVKLADDFKAAVLSEMKQEAVHVPNVSTKKKKANIRLFGATAAALCAAAVILFMLRPAAASYITPMEEGMYYDTVELKNGEIHFVKNRVAISITPNAGQVVIGGTSKADGNDGKEIEILEEVVAESGGGLLFQKTGQTNLPEIAEDSWSYIGDTKIYVTVLNTEKVRYQAVFEKDNGAYQVVGTDVTQKEFIDYLYKKIKE